MATTNPVRCVHNSVQVMDPRTVEIVELYRSPPLGPKHILNPNSSFIGNCIG